MIAQRAALLRSLLQRRAARDLAWMLGGRGAQMVFALLGSILSARALGPPDLGRFGLVISTVTICGTLADAGLTYTSIKFIAQHFNGEPQRARGYARAYFFLRASAGAAASLLGFLLSEPLAVYVLARAELTPYLQLAFVTLLSLGISSYPGTVLTALSAFKRLSLAGVLNAAITVSGIVFLFAGGRLDLGTLVAWNVLLPLASTLPAWFLLPRGWLPWQLPVGSGLQGHVRELTGFSKWLALSAIGSIIAAQGDVILLGRLQGPAAVGVYSVALALALRLDTLNQSLLTVLLPRASKLSGEEETRRYLRRVSSTTVPLALVLGVLALVAQPLIVFLYGGQYSASALLLLALLPAVLFDLATSSLFLAALPLNRPRVLALSDWLRVGSLGLGGWLLIPGFSGFGAAAARLLSRIVGATYTIHALRRSPGADGRSDGEEMEAASRWAS